MASIVRGLVRDDIECCDECGCLSGVRFVSVRGARRRYLCHECERAVDRDLSCPEIVDVYLMNGLSDPEDVGGN